MGSEEAGKSALVTNSVRVPDPWHRYRREADSNVYEYRRLEDDDMERCRFGPDPGEWFEHLSATDLATEAAEDFRGDGGWECWDDGEEAFEIFKNGESLGVFEVYIEFVPSYSAVCVKQEVKRESDERL